MGGWNLTLATRGSALAQAQANWVRDRLRRAHPDVDVRIRTVRTAGDRAPESALTDPGVRGFFTSDIERLLLARAADIAVHSLKDLPVVVTPGLTLAAIPERADPRDVLVSRSGADLTTLPAGAVIGASSLRRQAQLRRARPDLRFHPLRGNVDTRLHALDKGLHGMEAVVLAAAGLIRLGMEHRVTQWLDPDICLPAPGQGALAIQTRAGDTGLIELLEVLDCPEARFCVTAERATLARLGGGCRTPVGVLARMTGAVCAIEGAVIEASGAVAYRRRLQSEGRDPIALGRALADALIADGADQLL